MAVKNDANVDETGNNEIVKRKSVLAEKALWCKTVTLQKDLQAKVKQMKGVITALCS